MPSRLSPEIARTGGIKWLEREAETLSAISHPNIVNFHESGESDGVHSLVLEYVQGRALSEIIRERGVLTAG